MHSYPMAENYRIINDECFDDRAYDLTLSDEDILNDILSGSKHDITQLTESDLQENLIEELADNPSLTYMYARDMINAKTPFELQKVAVDFKEHLTDLSLKLIERYRDDCC